MGWREQLDERIIELNYSRQEFAKIIKVDLEDFDDMLNGKREMNLNIAIALNNYFEIIPKNK